MAVVIPAIIAKDFKEVKDKIAKVEGLTDWVQIDIVDGLFAPTYTWQTADDLMEIGGKTKIEVHLMIEHPETEISVWQPVADRITIHYEATDHLEAILNSFTNVSLPTQAGVEVGLALKLQTPVDVLAPWLPRLNAVQLMGIAAIGSHGHLFDESVLLKISALRKLWPSGTINIDGGINLATGKLATEAGATGLVIGSALWQASDLGAEIEKYKSL